MSRLAILMILGLTALIVLILQPQLMFGKQMDYRTVSIYANEDITAEIEPILDSAISLIAQSELYDPDYHFDVFLAHNTTYNVLDSRLMGSWAAARAIDNNITIKVKTDVRKRLAILEGNQLELTYVIAHEMIHCLQNHVFGKWAFNPLNHPPMWKMEGYPEYIGRARFASMDSSELREEVAFYLQHRPSHELDLLRLDDEHLTPNIYFKGKLMVEFLIEIKGLTYAEILDDERTEQEVWKDMMNWCHR